MKKLLVPTVLIAALVTALRAQLIPAGPPAPLTPFSVAVADNTLGDLIRDVAFARGAPNARFPVDRVLLILTRDRISALATDGARLCRSTHDLDKPEKPPENTVEALLPRDLNSFLELLAAPDAAPVQITSDGSTVIAHAGGQEIHLEVVSSAGSRTFPDYNRVIPTTSTMKVTMHAGDYKTAAAAMRHDMLAPRPNLEIAAEPGKPLSLVADHMTNFHYAVPATCDGTAITLGCKADFLCDAGDLVRDQPVEISLNTPTSAIAIRTGEVLYVVMPVMPARVASAATRP